MKYTGWCNNGYNVYDQARTEAEVADPRAAVVLELLPARGCPGLGC
jgi:hypothetical protein